MGDKAVGRLRNDGEARVGTGVPGLDEMLEGGFPAGSLITLAGRPGTGKTIFASQFLYQGARDAEEPGMYVSMLEGRKAYLRNLARLGFDILPLEKKGLFRFLEMPTLTAEGLPAIWEEIVRNIEEADIVRLVIDSFTAMSQAFGSQGDIRVFTHMLLGKIIGGAGCTTLMITETPPGFLGEDSPNPGMLRPPSDDGLARGGNRAEGGVGGGPRAKSVAPPPQKVGVT